MRLIFDTVKQCTVSLTFDSVRQCDIKLELYHVIRDSHSTVCHVSNNFILFLKFIFSCLSHSVTFVAGLKITACAGVGHLNVHRIV
jgi:hypothetical protein